MIYQVIRGLAGFYLAFLLLGCGTPVYQLDGKVFEAAKIVCLLDSTALEQVDFLVQKYQTNRQNLTKAHQASLDSLTSATKSLNGPISTAQRVCQTAEEKYQRAFGRMLLFRSFGGNPIFTQDDMTMSAQSLLSEIADRFYKGRAFSLETEGEVRRYIQQELVPIEQEVKRAQGRLAQLKRSKSGRSDQREQLEKAFEEKKKGLIQSTNEAIQLVFKKSTLLQAEVDKTNGYRFDHLPVATYCLYVPQNESKGILLTLSFTGHMRQNFNRDEVRDLGVKEGVDQEG